MNFKVKFLSSALIAAIAVSGANAQTVSGNAENGFEIKAGKVVMTVSAKEGGKIMSYKYGEQEMLAQSRIPNQYGSTFWTSPQNEWYWPPVMEFDRAAYTVEFQDNKSLVLSSQVGRKLPFQIIKQFLPDSKGRFISINYSIVNKGEESRKVAPWEITRVVADEKALIFFEADSKDITPNGLIPFVDEAGASWYNPDVADQNRKINSDGKGWLAFAANGYLMVKKFDDLTLEQPAPEEAEIQVYVNQGKTYIELESQGAYTTLAPGEELTWTVKWYLTPLKDKAVPSKSLLKLAKKTIK